MGCDLEQVESSQRQHHQAMLHNKLMCDAEEQHAYACCASFGLCPVKDGNQWCVLLSPDLQEGTAGFGNTPHEAIIAWHKAMREDDDASK